MAGYKSENTITII